MGASWGPAVGGARRWDASWDPAVACASPQTPAVVVVVVVGDLRGPARRLHMLPMGKVAVLKS